MLIFTCSLFSVKYSFKFLYENPDAYINALAGSDIMDFSSSPCS